MKKRLLFWFTLLVFLVFSAWNSNDKVLANLTGFGLLLNLGGAIFLALDVPTKKIFEERRVKREKQYELMKQGKPTGWISAENLSDKKLNDYIFKQHQWGTFFLVTGFIFQLSSVIIQIYSSS